MANETTAATNTVRQNEHPHLKKQIKCIVLFIYFLIKKIISEIVPLCNWLKNRNQRIDTGGKLLRRGAYTWSNKEKVGVSADGPIRAYTVIAMLCKNWKD